MSRPESPRVDLRAAARKDALALAGWGALALIAGPIITFVGAVFVVGLVVGPLLIVGGLVAVAVGLWGAAMPMSHSAMRALGATTVQREAALNAIEAELAGSVQRVQLSSGAVIAVTPRYFVLHGNGLLLARREDLLWAYGKVTTHTRYGLTTGKTHALCIVTRHGAHDAKSRDAQEAAAALALFGLASPRAFVGYRDDLAGLARAALAAQVDRVPFTTGGGEAYPLHAATPSSLVPGASAPASRPTMLPWVGLAGGIALASTGVLSGALFGWIASHPQNHDDVRFGSLCAIASVVVCFGPGMLAAAFAAWRLFARATR